jgi:hypothetical protein
MQACVCTTCEQGVQESYMFCDRITVVNLAGVAAGVWDSDWVGTLAKCSKAESGVTELSMLCRYTTAAGATQLDVPGEHLHWQ